MFVEILIEIPAKKVGFARHSLKQALSVARYVSGNSKVKIESPAIDAVLEKLTMGEANNTAVLIPKDTISAIQTAVTQHLKDPGLREEARGFAAQIQRVFGLSV